MLKYFRHFLDVPKLTETELSELNVFAYNLENQQSTQLKPTAITDKYVIVRANNFTSFMVHSSNCYSLLIVYENCACSLFLIEETYLFLLFWFLSKQLMKM